uniref:ribonuclease H n=1 Tax=Ascaris suum TaxID=6253 RepID=F1LB21_ASCSU
MKDWRCLAQLRNTISSNGYCWLHQTSSAIPSFDAILSKYRAATEQAIRDERANSIAHWQEERAWLSAPVVYCDGAYDWLTGKAGIGIFWGPSDPRNLHLAVTGCKITNIRAEVQAVSIAILQASSLKMQRICIKTDCNFAVKVINLWMEKWRKNGWRKASGAHIENIDDIKKLNDRLELLKVRIEHVYAHQKFAEKLKHEECWQGLTSEERDAYGNFYSDHLAQLGIDEPMMTDIAYESLITTRK